MLLFFCGLVLFLGMREPSDAFPPFTTAGPTYVNPTFSPGLRRTRMENAIISTNTNQHPGDWRAAGQIMYEKPDLTKVFGPCHSGGTICLLHLKISIFNLIYLFLVYRGRLGESSRRSGTIGNYFERSSVYGSK